jgi:hypothetical protein
MALGSYLVGQGLLNPPQRLKIGSALAAFGKKHGGIDLVITRDTNPVKPVVFE